MRWRAIERVVDRKIVWVLQWRRWWHRWRDTGLPPHASRASAVLELNDIRRRT